MKPKIILVNPWIYDFAAANLWSRPLGLLRVAEYLGRFDLELKLIDCTDSFTIKKFGRGSYPRQIVGKPDCLKAVPRHYARYGIGLEEFKETLRNSLPCDIILITSIMSYWYPGVQEAIKMCRALSPGTPVILGGIYATLFHEHTVENSGADYVYKGRIEDNESSLSSVGAGLKPAPAIETVIGQFGCKLHEINSAKPYYRLGLYRQFPFAPVLTSYGCPFKCSYCASAVLNNNFLQREPVDVIREINELHKTGVRDFAFYDDALLVNAGSHIKVILKETIKFGLKLRFHCPNGIHARFIDDELAHLMKQSGFTTLRLGLETINEGRQATTGGKVTSESFVSAVRILKKHGFTKENIGAYLMYGMPGQRLKEVIEGVDFLKGTGVRTHLTEFSPIPHTSCWEELKSMGIINDGIDPLLTNNTVFTHLFSDYDPDALDKLKLDVKQYNSV
ncbi:MAG: radical SAM protein [Nitrospirae bacterium]|nr:radical SAM protein [Nitrospirota bacterium]